MVSLSEVLPTVRDAYRVQIETRDRKLSRMLAALVVAIVLLMGAAISILVEYAKLKRPRNQLSSVNGELHKTLAERNEAIAGLTEANRELTEANQQKTGLLAYAYKLTADYINALEDFRKQLLKKLRSRKTEELAVLIDNPELKSDMYQLFYDNFDKAGLSIYPALIEDYNLGVADDAKAATVQGAKSKTLNTKLRIYALKRLGVTKSAEIARMLNLSIRTVYNNNGSGNLPSDEEGNKD